MKVAQTHLLSLESEAVEILWEDVSEAMNTVILYSIGKDSALILHLAKKAFYPSTPPFLLIHEDTTRTTIDEVAEQIVNQVPGAITC
jgi:sulfate adenylyltransferase subunit 2